MARQLATIQRISKLTEIEGADNIQKANILGWEVVVRKDEFQEKDLVVYIEIDSIVPDKPDFEFLRSKKFRIKTLKLKGVISQGIAFPTSILNPYFPKDYILVEGEDVTNLLGITKYDPEATSSVNVNINTKDNVVYPKWFPKSWRKFVNKNWLKRLFIKKSGNKPFPTNFPKSDETRIQVLQPLLDRYEDELCYMTEKLDGSSITIYIRRLKLWGIFPYSKFGVCSRNYDLCKTGKSAYWEVVTRHNLEKKMREYFKDSSVVLQGEMIGPNIQGNKYKLKETDIRFFNVYFPEYKEFGNISELSQICYDLKEQLVPIVGEPFTLPKDIPTLVEMAKGFSILCPTTIREGIVIRLIEDIVDEDFGKYLVKNRVSFKSINPDFLLKNNQ